MVSIVVLSGVIDELRTMKRAVNTNDQAAFMTVCDEEVSPATHAVMTMIAFGVILAFMTLKYSSVYTGGMIIGGTTYLLALIYWLIVEFDDPCHGLWVIKEINPAWLKDNPKEWRRSYHFRRSQEARERIHERASKARANHPVRSSVRHRKRA